MFFPTHYRRKKKIIRRWAPTPTSSRRSASHVDKISVATRWTFPPARSIAPPTDTQPLGHWGLSKQPVKIKTAILSAPVHGALSFLPLLYARVDSLR